MYDNIHPQVGIDRLYLDGKGGGRGLLEIEATKTREIINTAESLSTDYEEGHCVNIVKSPNDN
jgi:hypothetical protein